MESSKSIDEWIKQTQHYANHYRERYDKSQYDLNCSDTVLLYYRSIYENNNNFHDLLVHIKRYGAFYPNITCRDCAIKSNTEHCDMLKKTYESYGKHLKFVSYE